MYNDIIQLKTKHGHHELNKANYRPLTVLPALNNIFERLLAAQLGDFYNSILSDYISSYRKFHSCETSLLRMTEEWRRMKDARLFKYCHPWVTVLPPLPLTKLFLVIFFSCDPIKSKPVRSELRKNLPICDEEKYKGTVVKISALISCLLYFANII